MSSFVLKILACAFMLIDHIGFTFFPQKLLFRVIGRLAFPIFAFQAGIGYEKTRNKEKYILRMIIFTIISQIPFELNRRLVLKEISPLLNIGATLTLGLLAIHSYEKIKNPILKYLCIAGIIAISIYVPMDYSWYGILVILFFYIYRNDIIGTSIFIPILVSSYCYYKNSLFNLPSFLAISFIAMYNGKKGRNCKYIFYVFYPVHLLVLSLIKYLT